VYSSQISEMIAQLAGILFVVASQIANIEGFPTSGDT
jgi:hypothetical protein